MRQSFRRLVLCIVCLLIAVSGFAQQISVTPDRESGIYRAGESVTWKIEVTNPTELSDLRYKIKSGGLCAVRDEQLKLEAGQAVIKSSRTLPGWLLLEVQAKGADGKDVTGLGGALFSPEEIRPSAPVPSDFAEFWKVKLAELATVPMNSVVEKAESGAEGVDYFLVTLDNIRGTHIHGQLARPSKPGPAPALLIVQWAGVYPLEKAWAIDRAREGWLVFDVQAHDLPVAEPGDFYKEQFAGPLKDYWAIGNEDRETSYFLRMYLSCYRAAEYLTTRHDWDGRTLVVTGASQGGLQTILTAAIFPKVTAALADVPAGCDETAPEVGQAPGWPMWPFAIHDRDEAKVKAASRYYDIVNFAPWVKCPVLIGAGLIDTTCPPPGIFAAANQFAGPREVIVMPQDGHIGKHTEYNARWKAWLDSLREGEAIPAAASRSNGPGS